MPKLYGLILIGGQSRRMGKDKSLIHYHGISQREYLYNLLDAKCDQVYLSCNREQLENINLPYILDEYCEGPITGILSAYKNCPEAAWLVLACDMPGLIPVIIQKLISHRSHEYLATCFSYQFPEPLCTIWEPSGIKKLKEFYDRGGRSPKYFLQSHEVNAVPTDSYFAKQLTNVNE